MKADEIVKISYDAILQGETDTACKMAWQWLETKEQAFLLLEKALMPAIQETGNRWENGDYFLPELVASAEAMKSAVQILEPHFKSDGQASALPAVVIGTVFGDIHDIGKSVVASMLRANGFPVFDLGVDVKPSVFFEATIERNARLVCMSSLLTTTMTGMRDIIHYFESHGDRSHYKFMTGGAPVTREWATSIGADGYAGNAVEAVEVAQKLIREDK